MKSESNKEWRTKNADHIAEYRRNNRPRYRQHETLYNTKYPDKYRAKNRRNNQKRLARKREEQEKMAGRPRPNKCEIYGCDGPIYYDHCHRTGKFRGWICRPCNTILGLAKDDPEKLTKLIEYLTNAN